MGDKGEASLREGCCRWRGGLDRRDRIMRFVASFGTGDVDNAR